VEALIARLKDLNPGFDGQVLPTIEGGVVTGLEFSTLQVSDISPVHVFTNLRHLRCCAGGGKTGKLLDLSPLRGLSLTHLFLGDNPVRDLSPLEGMKLVTLHCPSTNVADLSPLQGMPLEKLDCGFTRVADLSPLRGMKLREADFQVTRVADLSPLQGMPLRALVCHGLRVPDLSPLKGMPLEFLNCNACALVSDLSALTGMPLYQLGVTGTNVTDLTPLKGMITLKRVGLANTGRLTDLSPLMGMQLEHIVLTPKNISQGLDILRDMKSLETIVSKQAWPAAEFWERYDEGEFND
jgi:Leucine-rich repeat (LRR) protein